jgi:hypothetical protein
MGRRTYDVHQSSHLLLGLFLSSAVSINANERQVAALVRAIILSFNTLGPRYLHR